MFTAPIQPLDNPFLRRHGVNLFIKREDLLHPLIKGNKWYKLRYNLDEARTLGHDTLLTFGGAFSNHIYATAAAGKLFGFKTIGVIRGEETMPLNKVLTFAVEYGMQLCYMDRQTYRQKHTQAVADELHRRFGNFYMIPEGGANVLAVRGCTEIVKGVDIEYDVVCCACGTGGTLAGIIAGAPAEKQKMGFAALKGGEFLYNDVTALLQAYFKRFPGSYTEAQAAQLLDPQNSKWSIRTEYHFGGYAKTTPMLLEFTDGFARENGIQLDPVYTGKMMFGLYDLIGKGMFAAGTRILAIHSGGVKPMYSN